MTHLSYSTPHVEAALCIWEELLEARPSTPDLDHFWDRVGTARMRHYAMGLSAYVVALWEALDGCTKDDLAPFDWEYVPAALGLVRWGSRGPELPTQDDAVARMMVRAAELAGPTTATTLAA